MIVLVYDDVIDLVSYDDLFAVSKTPSKFDKVVKREVCRITTKGTKTFSFLSGECADSQCTYLLAIAEKVS